MFIPTVAMLPKFSTHLYHEEIIRLMHNITGKNVNFLQGEQKCN